MPKAACLCLLSTLLFSSVLFYSGCSSGKVSSSATGYVNVRVSDPATCSGRNGSFSHIYVTITDVQVSASGGNGGSGWIDLTPALSQNPQQVDLLGQADNQCFLATLGATTALQPGNYQ